MNSKITFSIAVIFNLIFAAYTSSSAQEAENKEHKQKSGHSLVEGTFNNPTLINNQTIYTLEKHEFEFSYQQRFGHVHSSEDMFGLYSSSNMRFGIDYGITDRLMLGVGMSKFRNIVDFNLKYSILRQNESGGMPVSLSYFGEIARNGLSNDSLINQDGKYDPLNRISYFHEIMVSRKFNERLSLQASLNFAYFNFIESHRDNSNVGISLVGAYKISKRTSIIVDFDYPVTQPKHNPQKPNLGLGLEFSSKKHCMQIFVCTSESLVNDELRVLNESDILKREFRFGFNISHNWELKSK